MKSKTFFNPWLYVLLFLFCSTFLCAQESEDNVASSIYFGFGLCLPTKTLIDYYPGDPTHGKGYRLSGGEYFVSHLFTFKNQGIITSFNYAVNQYNYKGQLADDISLTQVQADDSWKQMEFLTGYYRKFLFHKHLFIDMKIIALIRHVKLCIKAAGQLELQVDWAPVQPISLRAKQHYGSEWIMELVELITLFQLLQTIIILLP
jgi:hypothetical protein